MTEWISGVNIPSCQLMIGMGVPLHRIPDIRRLFGKDPKGTSPIDYDAEAQIPPSGVFNPPFASPPPFSELWHVLFVPAAGRPRYHIVQECNIWRGSHVTALKCCS